jgi:hypothetical protein
MGSVMLRAQHLWSRGSLSAAYSPKLADGPSDSSFTFDWGATNAVHRGQLSASYHISDSLRTEVLLYKEAGSDVRLGASVNALISDSLVAYAEGTYSREIALVDQALATAGMPTTQPRFNGGVSYTTSTRLSLTAEYHYNGFAVDENGWEQLGIAGPAALAAYYQQAAALQDNAARSAVFLYAVQRDLGRKNLDLTALLKLNLTDRSRLIWIDLTQRLPKFDLSLRALASLGAAGSEFGFAPTKFSAGAVLTAYY